MRPLFLAFALSFLSVAGAHHVEGEDVMHVRLPQGATGMLVLQDGGGRVVREVGRVGPSAVMAVDLAGLPVGVYTLRVIGDDRGWSGRLVVDR
ncbi:MAG: hypothetical protein IT228_15040 [Flavobacteriales bacterium]|nr:hypothetical protein [Flavobacteriales bacterium]MCC6578654.1 hypothetical protein [Flavobacteriales bacterium]NUQ14506.1 hypothetical protein [Flavobacteriales bacterium]